MTIRSNHWSLRALNHEQNYEQRQLCTAEMQVKRDISRFQKPGETGRPTSENDYNINKKEWGKQWSALTTYMNVLGDHPKFGFVRMNGKHVHN